MLVINLFGGDGSGKTTLAAGLFFQLKIHGYHTKLIADQFPEDGLIKQLAAARDRLKKAQESNFDVVVTDEPLMGLLPFARMRPVYAESVGLICALASEFINVNILVERRHAFDVRSRTTEAESARYGAEIATLFPMDYVSSSNEAEIPILFEFLRRDRLETPPRTGI